MTTDESQEAMSRHELRLDTCPKCNLPYVAALDVSRSSGTQTVEGESLGRVCWQFEHPYDLRRGAFDSTYYIHPRTLWAYQINHGEGYHVEYGFETEAEAQRAGPPDVWVNNEDVDVGLAEMTLDEYRENR